MFKDQAKQEAARFRILTEVSQQIISILDIDVLLEQVVQLLQQTFNYYHVGIGLIEDEDVVYRIGAGVLWDAPSFQFKPARLKVGMEGITGWVAGTGQAALVPDVTWDSRYVRMQGSETRSELTVPITVKGQTIGVLDVQSQQIDGFDQTDLELMQSLASLTGIAIENARLFANVGHRAEQFRVLTEVSQHIISSTGVNELMETSYPLKASRRALGMHNTDGLIVFTNSVEKSELEHLRQNNFPIVLLHQTPPESLDLPVVTIENKSGAQKLVDHLIEIHNCRRIVFFTRPRRTRRLGVARARLSRIARTAQPPIR